MINIARIQELLQEQGIDGWLLCNFLHMNPIADRILDLSQDAVRTRRYYYFIPVSGDAVKLVHRVESEVLDELPGEKIVYLSWQSLGEGLKTMTEGRTRIAMEFSAHNAIPYIARVDAGTVDLLRYIGKEIVSSGNVVQEFEAALTDEQIEMHKKAAQQVRLFVQNAFDEIRTRIDRAGEIKEY